MAGGQLPFGLAPSGELTAYQPSLRESATDWLRGLLFSDDRAGQAKAERLANVLDVTTPFGLATGVNDATREAAGGRYGPAAIMAGAALLPGPNPNATKVEQAAVKGFKAYHGSPHDFDRFDMSKIGTGEGAQAYGHGLYFAGNEDVARGYRDSLAKWVQPDPDIVEKYAPIYDDLMRQHSEAVDKGDWSQAFDLEKKQRQVDRDAQSEMASRGHPSGRMYEVQINADPNAFLDWDKPLSEQSDAVKRGLEDAGVLDKYSDNLTGAEIYQRAVAGADPGAWNGKREYTAQALNQLGGIPGIKYLDAGSRAAGDGSRNYVLFDDKMVEILRKYGLAGLLPAGAAAFGSLNPQQQNETY